MAMASRSNVSTDTTALIACNQHIFHVSCTQEGGGCKLKSYGYRYDHLSKSFTRAYKSKRRVDLDDDEDVSLQSCKAVHAFDDGLKNVYILLKTTSKTARKKKKDASTRLLLFNLLFKSGAGDLKLRTQIVLPSSSDSGTYALYDGPTAVSRIGEKWRFVIFAKDKATVHHVLEPILDFSINKQCIEFLSADGQLKRLRVYGDGKDEIATLQSVIPTASLSANSIEKAYLVRSNNSLDKVFVCANQELLEFCSGKLIRWTSLPFSNVREIIPFRMLRYILILSSSESICAVEQKEFKVVKIWNNVKNLLLDDFLRCGTPSLILTTVNRGSVSEILNKCIITNISQDFNLQHEPEEAMEIDTSTNEMESKALNVLRKQHKAIKMAVAKATGEFQSKKQFICDTVSKLEAMPSSNSPSLTRRPMAVVNILGNSIQYHSEKSLMESPIALLQFVQRLKANTLIIILQILNRSKRNIRNLALQLTTDDSVDYQCYYFDVVDDKVAYFDSASSVLKPDQSTMLVATLPFKQTLFTKLNLRLHVSLCFRDTNIEESDECGWSPLRHLYFGQVAVVFSEAGVSLETQRNRNAFCQMLPSEHKKVFKFTETHLEMLIQSTISSSIEVMVKSTQTTLINLKEKLQNRFNMKECGNMLVWDKSSEILSGVALTFIGNCFPNEQNVIIMYSHESEILLFLHLFYQNLPKDLLILPANNSALFQKLKHKLQEELTTINSLAANKEFDPTRQEPGRTAQKRFSQMQVKFQSRFKVTLSNSDYSHFRQKLLEREIETDNVVGHINFASA